MDDEEEEGMEEEDAAAPSGSQPAALPGSLPDTDCLFCPHHSRSLLKNVAHMTREHSFFIPDVEFLVDLRGLIRYLGRFLVRVNPNPDPDTLPFVLQGRRSGGGTCVCGATRGGAASTPPRPSRVT